ncbi:MAG TPA: hypothetical protein DDY71_16730 [Spirochaetia bacterium]|nr:hypothetical protein [Spirochaetia bacterium]HBI39289.1 hypothetical protein [Spirochaetia bacterium]
MTLDYGYHLVNLPEGEEKVQIEIFFQKMNNFKKPKESSKSKKDAVVLLGTSISFFSWFILPQYFGPLGLVLGFTNLLRGFVSYGIGQIIISGIAYAYWYKSYTNLLNIFLNYF